MAEGAYTTLAPSDRSAGRWAGGGQQSPRQQAAEASGPSRLVMEAALGHLCVIGPALSHTPEVLSQNVFRQ